MPFIACRKLPCWARLCVPPALVGPPCRLFLPLFRFPPGTLFFHLVLVAPCLFTQGRREGRGGRVGGMGWKGKVLPVLGMLFPPLSPLLLPRLGVWVPTQPSRLSASVLAGA